jgi:hypothetical protein
MVFLGVPSIAGIKYLNIQFRDCTASSMYLLLGVARRVSKLYGQFSGFILSKIFLLLSFHKTDVPYGPRRGSNEALPRVYRPLFELVPYLPPIRATISNDTPCCDVVQADIVHGPPSA